MAMNLFTSIFISTSPSTMPHFTFHNLPILFTVLLLILSISAVMENSEKEALFSIMESMSSDRDWRSYSPDPCSPGFPWPGLECKPASDRHFHITKLVFGAPPNPTCLSTAKFPSQIFNLPFLQSAHFINCFTAMKTPLFFPNSHSSSLVQLSLKANPALSGIIPPQISSLKSLQVLTLSQNHLYGKIPDTISDLRSLIHLDLSYNSLTGTIPAQIGMLSKLVDLDLSYNSLTGPIPTSIGGMQMLQKLDMSSNLLTDAIPSSLTSLKMLTFLALSNNRLSGYPNPPNRLTDLQTLQYLIMDGNPINGALPHEIGTLDRLVEIRLANSGYTGIIPPTFSGLKNLTTLSLENNHLTGEIPPEIGGLAKIYHLNLSRNMLTGVVPFAAEFLRRLGRNMDMSGNGGLCVNETGELKGVRVCATAYSEIRRPLESSATTTMAYVDERLLFLWIGLLSFHCFSRF